MSVAEAERKKIVFDRWVDIGSVVLISVATVLTAWCGYESARWTALQTRLYNTASAERTMASIYSNRANTLTTIDVVTFLRFVASYAEGRTNEMRFIYNRFRPEMRHAMDAWIATKPLKNPNAPSTPFAMKQYRLQIDAQADRATAQATASFEAAQSANEHADWYVRLTVIFAAVSFLAGISTKFVYPFHISVVTGGFLMLAFGLIKMFGQPLR